MHSATSLPWQPKTTTEKRCRETGNCLRLSITLSIGVITKVTSELDNLIAKAKKLARNRDEEAAMTLANELVAHYPNEMKVWLLRGYLHELGNDYTGAVADLTRAIEINAMEPHLFFTRGANRFALGDDQSAIDDFTEGLDLCDLHKNDYYRETLHFWRAEALLRLGKKHEALADLARVHDGFRFWTYKLRTKADLLDDCHRLAG
jgi:tetratricopeptide (TPR) repeat protein